MRFDASRQADYTAWPLAAVRAALAADPLTARLPVREIHCAPPPRTPATATSVKPYCQTRPGEWRVLRWNASPDEIELWVAREELRVEATNDH